ncbi:MAG: DUF481 domain-containing protein [Gemmatimonadota bacterium]
MCWRRQYLPLSNVRQRPSHRAAGRPLSTSGSPDPPATASLIALTTGIRFRHLQTRLFRFDGSVGFRYGESQGAVAARHFQTSLNFDMGPAARVAPFVALMGERDPFLRLDLRSKVGTGVRYAFYKREESEASVRAAVQYNHERFTSAATLPARTNGTWSLEFKGAQRIGAGLRIENATNYNPIMGDFGNYTLDSRSKLSTKVTSQLALTLGHTYSYDATPAPTIRHADQRFQAGLTIDF